MGERLLARVPVDRESIVVLNNAWAISPSSGRRPNASDGCVRLGHLANLSIEKGALVVHETACKIAENSTNRRIHLSYAGPCDPTLKQLLSRALTPENLDISFTGPLGSQDKYRWYRGLDCFLFPTAYRTEAYPLVLLEAMSVGTPVIASSLAAIPEFINRPPYLNSVHISSFVTSGPGIVSRILKLPTTEVASVVTGQFERLKAESESIFSREFAVPHRSTSA